MCNVNQFPLSCVIAFSRHFHFGYCEVRGHNDEQYNVKKTAEYLNTHQWVRLTVVEWCVSQWVRLIVVEWCVSQ